MSSLNPGAGANVVCSGITPAGYNSNPVWHVLTSSLTSFSFYDGGGLGTATVPGTCQLAFEQREVDDYTILGGSSSGLNFPIETCSGYTTQDYQYSITNPNGWTLVPFTANSETIDGASSYFAPFGSTVRLQAVLNGVTTGGCYWHVVPNLPPPTLYNQTIVVNGTAQTRRSALNLIPGTNAAVSCADNSGLNRTDCTIGVTPGTGTYYQTVKVSGTSQTQQPNLNLIGGGVLSVSCANNSGTSSTDCTFSISGAGSGTVTQVCMTGDGVVFASSVPGSCFTTTGMLAPALANAGAHTFLGNPTGSAAAPSYSGIGTQDATPNWAGVGGGSANAQTVTLAIAPTSLANFMMAWLPIANNSGAATLNVNSTGVESIKKCGAAALVANDLTTSSWALAWFDGTNYQLINPQATICGGASSSTFSSGTTMQAGNGNFQSSLYSTDSHFYGGQPVAGTSNVIIAAGYFQGGDETGATGTNAGGMVILRGGLTTSTSGYPGITDIGQGFFKGSTVTQWSLECVTTAAFTVADCGTSNAFPVGVATNAVTPVMLIEHGGSPITATAAVTIGDTVCWSSVTGGEVTDSGGQGACSTAHTTVGTVIATSGSVVVGSGSTKATVTLSTTLPLVLLRFE